MESVITLGSCKLPLFHLLQTNRTFANCIFLGVHWGKGVKGGPLGGTKKKRKTTKIAEKRKTSKVNNAAKTPQKKNT